MDTVKLDAKDRRVLYLLESNARAPLSKIARFARVSKQTVHYKIQNFIKRGVSSGFIAELDVAKLGFENYEVWIQLQNVGESERERLIDFFVGHERVRWVASCIGKIDLAVGVLAKSVSDFNGILSAILEKHGGKIRNYFVCVSVELYNFRKAYLLGSKAGAREHTFFGGEPVAASLDSADKKILSLLAGNARIPLIELAGKAGVSPNTARSKLKKLIDKKIITGFKALINFEKIGFENVEVLLSIQNSTRSEEKRLFEWCASKPECTFFLRYIGAWSADIALDVRNAEHVHALVSELRNEFSGIIKDFEIVSMLKYHKFNYLPMGEGL